MNITQMSGDEIGETPKFSGGYVNLNKAAAAYRDSTAQSDSPINFQTLER